MNEKPPSESSLDLALTQHPYDEDSKSQEVRLHLEVEPPQNWYYRIFPNSPTLMILLQVDLTFGDEPTTICEGCYEIEDISIFAWSSILGIKHCYRLCSSICRLPLNNKVDYLVHIIRCILDSL